ncbi:MAG: hypothetical protein QM613_06530 [Micrococcaceae bacterium]
MHVAIDAAFASQMYLLSMFTEAPKLYLFDERARIQKTKGIKGYRAVVKFPLEQSTHYNSNAETFKKLEVHPDFAYPLMLRQLGKEGLGEFKSDFDLDAQVFLLPLLHELYNLSPKSVEKLVAAAKKYVGMKLPEQKAVFKLLYQVIDWQDEPILIESNLEEDERFEDENEAFYELISDFDDSISDNYAMADFVPFEKWPSEYTGLLADIDVGMYDEQLKDLKDFIILAVNSVAGEIPKGEEEFMALVLHAAVALHTKVLYSPNENSLAFIKKVLALSEEDEQDPWEILCLHEEILAADNERFVHDFCKLTSKLGKYHAKIYDDLSDYDIEKEYNLAETILHITGHQTAKVVQDYGISEKELVQVSSKVSSYLGSPDIIASCLGCMLSRGCESMDEQTLATELPEIIKAHAEYRSGLFGINVKQSLWGSLIAIYRGVTHATIPALQ